MFLVGPLQLLGNWRSWYGRSASGKYSVNHDREEKLKHNLEEDW